MSKLDIKDIKEHCYVGGRISRWNFNLKGSFPEEETKKSGLRYFSFYTSSVEYDGGNELPDIEDAEIVSFDADEKEDCYEVRLVIMEAGRERELDFTCEISSGWLSRYKGMSYKNIYDGNVRDEKLLAYMDEEHLLHRDEYDMGEGVTVESYHYGERKTGEKKYEITHIVVNRYYKDGRQFFEHYGEPQHGCRFKELIHHSNGMSYIAYHTDLYGISFYELETGRHYDYIPEGMAHDYRWVSGESFIITDIHYDRDSDLLACGGCYWACPSGTFVMDFRDPLHYDPRMISVRDVVMGDYNEDEEYDEEYDDDWDFLRWEKDGLWVKTISEKNEHFITMKTLREELAKKRAGFPIEEFDGNG